MDNKILICPVCGNIIKIVKSSGVPVFCCGKPMVELIPNSVDAANEKHVPIFTINGNNINVKVGEIEHPMEEKHYIEWIMITTNKGYQLKKLSYNDKPEANFVLSNEETLDNVYAYCNLHGLWINKD